MVLEVTVMIGWREVLDLMGATQEVWRPDDGEILRGHAGLVPALRYQRQMPHEEVQSSEKRSMLSW